MPEQAPPFDPGDLAVPAIGPRGPLPVSVLTGFLGSGKTTLLRRLLDHPAMDETAVIINEFGEIGLDHLLVEKADEDTILLNSGCLCCTVRGDLVETMRRLFKQRVQKEVPPFLRLVVETTGLADPAPILHSLMNDPLLSARFRLDGVIATVDAATGARTLDRHAESVKQAAVADRLLLTKCDIAAPEAIAALKARLAALNPAAPLYEVADGAIEPARLFDAGLYNPATKSPDVQRWLKAEAYDEAAPHDHHYDHGHGDDHEHGHERPQGHDVNRHGDHIRAFCVTYDRPLDWERFNDWLEMLITVYGADILRLKGLLNVAGVDHPVVIHGVQHLFHPPARLAAWPDDDHRSRLVFITRDLDPALFDHTLRAFLQDQRDRTPMQASEG
jgi:G3E family GTPase